MIPPRASLPCGRCSLCVAPHQVGRPVRLPWSSIWPPCAIAVVRLGFWAWSRVGPRRSSRSGSPLGASPGVGGSRWWRWTVSPVSRALPTRSSHRPGRSWIPTRVVSLAGGKLDEWTCPVFCVSVLQVGVDSVGVGGGELGQGLVPVGGDLSFDELALGPALGCWQSFLLVAFSGSLVHRCRRSPAFASSGHRLIERGSGRGSSVILAQLVARSLDTVGGGGTSHEVGER